MCCEAPNLPPANSEPKSLGILLKITYNNVHEQNYGFFGIFNGFQNVRGFTVWNSISHSSLAHHTLFLNKLLFMQCLSEGKSSKEMRDKEQFSAISDALRCIGVPDEEIREIYRIVAGVMAFGNVEFIDSGDTRGKYTWSCVYWIFLLCSCFA